jgi:ferrochelatase
LQEYREVAEEAGISNFKRVPALNSDPDFINALADMTVDALEKPVRISPRLLSLLEQSQ